MVGRKIDLPSIHSHKIYTNSTGLQKSRMSQKQSNARLMAKDLISGCFGGIGIVAVGHPFDTLKVNILLLFAL